MKKITMKAMIIAGAMSLLSMNVNAQVNLNGVKNTGGKVLNSGKENKENSNSTSTTSSSTSTSSSSSTETSSTSNEAASKTTNSKSISVTTPTVFVTNELGGISSTPELKANDKIFVRIAFPKPVGEYFAESMGMSDVPSTGSYALAIGQNADDENPIVISAGNIFTSRYSSDNMLDFVLQGDQQLWESLERPTEELESKVSFNSITTMANVDLSTKWLDNALFFKNQTYEWEIFLFFMPWNSDDENAVKQIASAKFKYTMTAESKTTLISNLNFYDKQRFEKTPDDGINTGVHKANINKLVFSNQKMLKDFDDASALKTSFANLSGGVYARLYLKESMRNYYANFGRGKDVGGASYSLYFYVDGETKYRCFTDSELSKEEAHSLTSWSIPLAPLNNDDFEYDKTCVNRFAYVMSELADGKHNVTLKVVWHGGPGRDTGEDLASGEFSISIAKADRDAFVKKYGLQMPEKGLLADDPTLYAEVKKIAGPSAIEVRCPNTWEDKFDVWGTLTHRVTIVVYSYKGEDGRCYMDTFMVQQVKNANGFGPTTISNEKIWYGVDKYLPYQNSK